jgi:DNA-directed RNA polymerase specialized sigma24 family protein
LRSGADAEDVAQEAMLRAFRFFHGADVRAWLLQIVRNTCYTWLVLPPYSSVLRLVVSCRNCWMR